MTAPDFLPVLSHGSHTSPKEGACVMEYVSVLAGEPWTDRPACTHPGQRRSDLAEEQWRDLADVVR